MLILLLTSGLEHWCAGLERWGAGLGRWGAGLERWGSVSLSECDSFKCGCGLLVLSISVLSPLYPAH